jgi:hypothetical protein
MLNEFVRMSELVQSLHNCKMVIPPHFRYCRSRVLEGYRSDQNNEAYRCGTLHYATRRKYFRVPFPSEKPPITDSRCSRRKKAKEPEHLSMFGLCFGFG